MLNINLHPEYILSIFGWQVTNVVFTSFLVSIFILILALFFYFNRERTDNFFIKSVYLSIEKVYDFINRLVRDNKKSEMIFPVVMTIFVIILFSNFLALLPGFLGSFFIDGSEKYALLRSPNSDLNTTLALALISLFSIQFFSIKTLGLKRYILRFFNLTSPNKFILGFFELLSEVTKIFSFSFRLFGNIFAGEVLLLVTIFLVPYFIPIPFMFLEIFVGFIQAFIFAILIVIFTKTATIEKK